LVDGLIRLMHADVHEPVNLGNDEELTMLRLVAAIEAALRRPLKIQPAPLPQDDPVRRKADLTRARKLLNYEPGCRWRRGSSTPSHTSSENWRSQPPIIGAVFCALSGASAALDLRHYSALLKRRTLGAG